MLLSTVARYTVLYAKTLPDPLAVPDVPDVFDERR